MADDRRGGPGYRYEYEYRAGQYGSGSGAPRPPQPPKKPGSWSEWIWMAVLFLIPSAITKIIAVIWFINRVNAMSKSQKDACRQEVKQAARQTKDAFVGAVRDIAQEFRSGQAQTAQTQAAPPEAAQGAARSQPQQPRRRAAFDRRAAQKRAQGAAAAGTGLMIGGGVIAGIFGISSIAMLDEVVSWFSFENLAGLLLLLAFAAGGVGMLLAGLGKRRRAERYVSYLGYIGANREVSLARMASSFGVSVEKLCKDLRYMLSKDILPVGYLDLAEGRLFLTEAGCRQPAAEKEPPRQEPAQAAQAAAEQEDDILRQIRQVNDDIPDEAMSAKIDRIEEITGKILAYQKAHPNREAQLRSFLNYYLPTTLKILRAYAQLDAQGVEGENITAAKTRIEGMMDQVVAGFEKQLDKLFRDDAMDIASDVEVLENMLKKDGLSDDGMTMTM